MFLVSSKEHCRDFFHFWQPMSQQIKKYLHPQEKIQKQLTQGLTCRMPSTNIVVIVGIFITTKSLCLQIITTSCSRYDLGSLFVVRNRSSISVSLFFFKSLKLKVLFTCVFPTSAKLLISISLSFFFCFLFFFLTPLRFCLVLSFGTYFSVSLFCLTVYVHFYALDKTATYLNL